MTTPSPRLELQQRLYLLTRTQRWSLLAIGAMLIVLVVGLAAISFFTRPEALRSGEALLNAILKKLTSDPLDLVFNAILLLVLGLQLVYMRLANRHERLLLTPAGIEYRSPMPWALQALRPSWSLAWGQIRTASLQGTTLVGGPQGMALELEAGTRKFRIFPFQWVNPKQYQPLSPWAEFLKQRRTSAVDNVARVEASEVLQYMAAAAPQLVVQYQAQGAGFALEKNPRTKVVVTGFFLLLFYALGDIFFSGYEVYANEPPYGLFIAAGVLAMLLAGTWMQRGDVPLAENFFISLLFGAALGAAVYPAALRVNGLTAAEGLRAYQYRLSPALSLHPLDDGLPVLSFPNYPEYWSEFQPNSIHTFELRRGGLGFYQLNMQPVNLSMTLYYEMQSSRK